MVSYLGADHRQSLSSWGRPVPALMQRRRAPARAYPRAGTAVPGRAHRQWPSTRTSFPGDRLNGCKGPSFRDKRDEALMRLFSETGLRASECLALKAGQSARRARQDQSVALKPMATEFTIG